MDNIRIITTGGTIDKKYRATTGELIFEGSVIAEILSVANIYAHKISIESPMEIDSLDMAHKHRQIIADICQRCSEKLIVITHGTDTMVQTAAVIGSLNLDKTIIFTGAMRPYELRDSDGPANVASAINVVCLLPRGVFITMGGNTFPYDNVQKDTSIGQFIAINKGKMRSWIRYLRNKSIELWEMMAN